MDLPAFAIKSDQACRFDVLAFNDARPASARVQSIEKSRQQDGACTVDSIQLRQVNID